MLTAMTLFQEDPTELHATRGSVLADSWPTALRSFLDLRKAVEKPGVFDEGPYRAVATRLYVHFDPNQAVMAAFKAPLLKVAGQIKEFLKVEVAGQTEELLKCSGGNKRPGVSWKEGLSETCVLDTLKERWEGVLAKCQGGAMKKGSDLLHGVVTEFKAHVVLTRTLDPEIGIAYLGGAEALLAGADAALNESRATKLEFWICKVFWSDKDKLDKRDTLLYYSNQYDGYGITGGRGGWMHPKIREMETEILSYAADDAASGASKKKKQRKAG